MTIRRSFGNVRRREHNRWQTRYRDPTGRTHCKTFGTRRDADRFLAKIQADLEGDRWFDPSSGTELLRDYAAHWLPNRIFRGRPLAPGTKALYQRTLASHILPTLGDLQLRQLSNAHVRAWHTQLTSSAGPGAVTAARSYRLLRAICHSAVADQEIPRNPCTIRGADREYSPERPVASIEQVLQLADAVGARWRALVLLATFCSLRIGELSALTRRDIDLTAGTVTVRASAADLPGGRVIGPPKTRAGRRTVTIPAAIHLDVADHLERFAQPGEDGAVFIGPLGGALREGNFVGAVWGPARRKVGVPQLHFHDLRHTGNNLAAGTGASLRELMVRMGHGSTRAALRYQHATRDRDTAIAQGISELIERVRPPAPPLPQTAPDRQPDAEADPDSAAS